MYKLREWIDEARLTGYLSLNPNAVEYLEGHPDKIDYNYISSNVNAINIIEKNLDMCNKYSLNCNKNMVNLLRNNKTLISYSHICYCEHTIEFIEELIKNNNHDEIDWFCLSYNGAAIHILEQYPEQIYWYVIICNKNAGHMVRNNLEKVEGYWDKICDQPRLINLIEEHPEKIEWYYLSRNKNAIHLLKNNLEKINVPMLCTNKNGFELLCALNHQFNNEGCYHKNIVYDYVRMKKTREQQPWYWDIKNEFI